MSVSAHSSTTSTAWPVAREVMGTFASRSLAVLLGVLTTVVVTRLLGPEGRGVYAVCLTINLIGLQLGNLGLHASNTYIVSRRPSALAGLAANSLLISFGVGGALAIGGFATFAIVPALRPADSLTIGLALAAIPVALASLMLLQLVLGVGGVRRFNVLELSTKAAVTAGVAVLALLGAATVPAFLAVALFTPIVAVAGAWAYLRRRFQSPPAPEIALLKEQGRYGLRAYVAALFAFLVLRSDFMLLQYLRGPESVGLYSAAVALCDALYLLPVVAGMVLFPRLARMDPEPRRRLALQSATAVGVGTMAAVIVTAALAPWLVEFLYGRAFLPSVPALYWLLAATVVLSANTILQNYFAAEGMPAIGVLSPALASVTNVGLNALLIPEFGTVGAACSSFAAYALMLVASLVYLSRRRGAAIAETSG